MFDVLQTLLDEPAFKSKVKYAIKTYHAKEKILEQGKPHKTLYLIRKGTIRIIISEEIKELNAVHPGIADLGPTDVVGEFGLYDEEAANADVIAITDCELVEIDIPTFRSFLEENSQIGYKIMETMFKTLIKRLRRADKTILKLYIWGIKAHKLDQHLGEGTNEK